MVEQGAEQSVLQPQEEGQKSLKQGQLKAAERQKGTEGTGRRSNSEWAGGLGSNRRVNGGDRAQGRQEVGKGGGGGADAWCEEPPWRNWVTESESQTAIMDMMLGGVTTSCATESKCPPSQDCKRAAAGRKRSNERK